MANEAEREDQQQALRARNRYQRSPGIGFAAAAEVPLAPGCVDKYVRVCGFWDDDVKKTAGGMRHLSCSEKLVSILDLVGSEHSHLFPHGLLSQ